MLIGISFVLSGCTLVDKKTDNSNQPDTSQITIPTALTTPESKQDSPTYQLTYLDNNKINYTDQSLGVQFEYPSEWSDSYRTDKINYWVRADDISDLSEICELGLCKPYVEDIKQKLNDGSIKGYVEFSENKGFIKKGCTIQGAPPLSPYYELNFIKDNKWMYFYVVDYKTTWPVGRDDTVNKESIKSCGDYIDKIDLPSNVNDSKYKTYNDFIDIIKKSFILE